MSKACPFVVGKKYKVSGSDNTATYVGINPANSGWCNHIFAFSHGPITERGPKGQRSLNERSHFDGLPEEVREPLKWEGESTGGAMKFCGGELYTTGIQIPPCFMDKRVKVTIEEILE